MLFRSDRTGGFRPFAKCKLMLGALLITFTATSCDIFPGEPTCYEPAALPETEEPSCYITADTTEVVPSDDTINAEDNR